MQKMMINEADLAERWNLSPKTLQPWRSEGRGPRFMKMSKRVVYPRDEVLDFESQTLRAAPRWWRGPDAGCRPPKTSASTRRPTRQASTGRCSRLWLRCRPDQ